MLEKLILAIIISFCLSLFLGVRLPRTSNKALSSDLTQKPDILLKLRL